MIAKVDHFEINPIHEGDAWKICDFCVANADRLKRFFPKTLEQNTNPTLSQRFVDKKTKQFQNKDECLFTLKASETQQLIGLIYLKELDWTTNQGEFAYAIDYNYKGKGIISKVVKKLCYYAFNELNLETLQIIVHKDNVPSVKVALNNDFKWQQTLNKAFTPLGENSLDMELYELYKD